MTRARRKTPQQKKAESYANDRVNRYSENSKSSRKNIRRRKQQNQQALRRRLQQLIPSGAIASDADLERADISPRVAKGRWFRKGPDKPLRDVVSQKLALRREQDVVEHPARFDFRAYRDLLRTWPTKPVEVAINRIESWLVPINELEFEPGYLIFWIGRRKHRVLLASIIYFGRLRNHRRRKRLRKPVWAGKSSGRLLIGRRK